MTTIEAHFSGDTPRVFVNGHRLPILAAIVAVVVPIVVVWDWRRGW